MQITAGELAALLKQHDPAKVVCFCGQPSGLEFFRIKTRGTYLQIEFNQGVSRDSTGRLRVDDYSGLNPGTIPIYAGDLAQRLSANGDYGDKPACFGDLGALEFLSIEDRGEFVSIEFAQRLYRDGNGSFVVEETRNGQQIREEFPPRLSTDGTSTRGALGAVRRAKKLTPRK